MDLLRILLLFAAAVMGIMASSSECIASPIVLVSNRSYEFHSCQYPIKLTGTDVEHVDLSFVNATPWSIVVGGFFMRNFSLLIRDLETPLRPTHLLFNPTQMVDDVRITVVRARLLRTKDYEDLVAISSVLSVSRVTLSFSHGCYVSSESLLDLRSVGAARMVALRLDRTVMNVSKAIYVKDVASLTEVTLSVANQSHVQFVSLMTVWNTASLSNVSVSLEHSIANATDSLVQVRNSSISKGFAPFSVIVSDSVILLGPGLGNWVYMCFIDRNSSVAAVFRFAIVNSAVRTTPTWNPNVYGCLLSSVTVANFHVGGEMHFLILNSAISVLSVPFAIIFGISGVTALGESLSLGSRMSLTVENSVVECSSTVNSLLYSVQSSNFNTLTLILTNSSVTLFTLGSDVSSGQGSILVSGINSLLVDSAVVISNSSIWCGAVCRSLVTVVVRQDWAYIVMTIRNLGFLPPFKGSGSSNLSYSLSNSSFFALVGPRNDGRPLMPVKPMISFSEATGGRALLHGPVTVDMGVFDGLLGGATSVQSPTTNRLDLANCGEIAFRNVSTGDLSDLSAQLLLPAAGGAWRRGPEAIVRSWRSNSANDSSGGGSCLPTATQSTQPTVSATRTRSRLVTESASLRGPREQNPPPVSAQRQVTGALMTVLGTVSGPAAAGQLQVLHAQRAISRCGLSGEPSAEELGDGGGQDNVPLDIASSPLQLRVLGGFKRGAVVGNIALLGCCCVVAAVVAVWKRSRAAEVGMPGRLYQAWGVLGVPTFSAALAVLTFDHDSSAPASRRADVALGAAGVAVTLVLLLLLIRAATFGFGGRAIRVPRKRSYTAIVRSLHVWYCPSTEHDDAVEGLGFVSGWEASGVLDYVKARQWFVLVEPLLGLLAAGLAAAVEANPGKGAVCASSNAVMTVACVAVLALLLVLKPHSVRSDHWLSASSAVLQSLTAGFGLLGRDISAGTEICQLALTAVYYAGSIAWSIATEGSVHILLFLRTRARRKRPRAKEPSASQARQAAPTAVNAHQRSSLAALVVLACTGKPHATTRTVREPLPEKLR